MKRIEFELPEEFIVECENKKQSSDVYFTYYNNKLNNYYKYILICNIDDTLHISDYIPDLDEEYQNHLIIPYKKWNSFRKELKVGDIGVLKLLKKILRNLTTSEK